MLTATTRSARYRLATVAMITKIIGKLSAGDLRAARQAFRRVFSDWMP